MLIKLLIHRDDMLWADKFKDGNRFFFVAETLGVDNVIYARVAEQEGVEEIKEIDKYFRNHCLKPYYLWYDDTEIK
jgi:hypothetical protein